MNRESFILYSLILVLTFGCGKEQDASKPSITENMVFTDQHSYAKPDEARVTHLSWDASINFETHTIEATATLRIDRKDNADSLWLDTNGLDIQEVKYSSGASAPYTIGANDPILGAPLQIALEDQTNEIIIVYRTSPDAAAVQWLNPQQTADKSSPFLFTQSQAILARSWVPIQDSPGIRFTYSAKVKVPEGLMALMSAENPQALSATGEYTFRMEQPIPAYLLALAVGDLRYKTIGPRSGVYAEPSVLDTAVYEFAELEEMIDAAEALYGAYRWGQYDLLILPPSFPFGGMENPRLTFATPTILAGDRSLTSLVAHELAHSWSGNLVTNATWNDFWLNEGFTVYFEQRIMEKLYGTEYSEMLASLEVQGLQKEMAEMMGDGREADTHLKLDLTNRNPDDGMTEIAYQKGYLFLRYLESQAGRERFDVFLKNYFDRNAFKVMTTEAFIDEVMDHLIKPERLNVGRVKLKEWIYEPGLPKDAVLPVSNRFDLVDDVRDQFLNGLEVSKLSTDAWSSHEWVYFVRGLPATLSDEKMNELDKAFGFTATGNAELLTAWLLLAIKTDYSPAYERLESFLINTGRRKFLMPLYTELVRKDATRMRAKSIYEKARQNYHYVSTSSIDELLNYETTN